MNTKQELIAWLDTHQDSYIDLADAIWADPETAWQEYKASRLQAALLAGEGFRIEWDLAGISTAFVAEWGASTPVIAFLGEYDALAGLSQKAVPEQAAVVEGGAGHGCGHNLLGTGAVAAAAAIRRWLEDSGMEGTVRYYGCPAEERGYAKTFMARAGAFDDVDAALNFHPGRMNMPSKGTSVGVYDMRFRFYGTTAHAGGSPHKGRSALDAVELMNVGVNYLREHVTEKVRIHYVITRGGKVPNIVPAEAEVWYFVRAKDREEMDQVAERVSKIAQGAALMTETRMERVFGGACSSMLNNHYLADLQYEAMRKVGPILYTDEERAFAEQINDAYPKENARDLFEGLQVPDELADQAAAAVGEPLLGENWPAMDVAHVGTGSTDVADASWVTPLSLLRVACYPTGASGHSWGVTAASGMSIGHKGMMHAAKVMAVAAMDLYSDPEHLRRARQEFVDVTSAQPYRTPLAEDVEPPCYPHPGHK